MTACRLTPERERWLREHAHDATTPVWVELLREVDALRDELRITRQHYEARLQDRQTECQALHARAMRAEAEAEESTPLESVAAALDARADSAGKAADVHHDLGETQEGDLSWATACAYREAAELVRARAVLAEAKAPGGRRTLAALRERALAALRGLADGKEHVQCLAARLGETTYECRVEGPCDACLARERVERLEAAAKAGGGHG